MTIRISGGAPLIQAALAAIDPVTQKRIILLGQTGKIKEGSEKLPESQKVAIQEQVNALETSIKGVADLAALNELEKKVADLSALLTKVEQPIDCNIFRGKFCPVVNVGGTISIAEPNSGSGTFSTDNLGISDPEYNYSPAGWLDGVGLTVGVENRMFKWGGLNWLLGLEGEFEKTQWNLDSNDRHDPLKNSVVTQIDYAVALTVGVEIPLRIKGGIFKSINLRVAPVLPWLSRARYRADVEAEGQTEGPLRTGTGPTFDASGRPGNPAVADWGGGRTARLHGLDIFLGGNVGPYSEAGFTFRWRRPEVFGDSVGNQSALEERCEDLESQSAIDNCIDSIPDDRMNLPIDVQGADRDAAILFTLRFRGDIASLLGRALGRK